MTRDEFIAATAALLAHMQVPCSLRMPVGGALEDWTALHTGLIGFGWAGAKDYEREIRRLLGPSEPAAGRYLKS